MFSDGGLFLLCRTTRYRGKGNSEWREVVCGINSFRTVECFNIVHAAASGTIGVKTSPGGGTGGQFVEKPGAMFFFFLVSSVLSATFNTLLSKGVPWGLGWV